MREYYRTDFEHEKRHSNGGCRDATAFHAFFREMCGTEDTALCVEHFRAVYEDFFEMDEKMIVDGSIGQLCRPCDRFESLPSVGGVSSLGEEMEKKMSPRTYS